MQTCKEKIKKRDSIISKQSHIIEEICENGKIQYNCTACHKCFHSRSQKYYHLYCNQLQNLIYKCEHCDKSFVRHSQWKYHNESHISPVNECIKCQKIFSNPLALKKHEALHKVEPKVCPHCNKAFKKKISLDQHIAGQHFNELQYGCAHCSKKYASKSTLQLHLQSHEKKRFECLFCGKQFQRNSILNLHLKRHNNTNVICNICQKAFSESGALARHRKIHEENGLQYHCKLCDQIILRKDNMTRHLNTIHTDEKFDNIVEVIRPPITDANIGSNQKNVESDNYNLKEKTEKNFLIIENKLLHKPFELKETINDFQNDFTNKTETVEYPLINQINVITAVPTYKTDIENTLHNFTQHYKTTDHQQVDYKLLENPALSCKTYPSSPNSDLKFLKFKQTEFVVQNETNVALNNHNQNQTEQQTKIQDSCNNQVYFQQHTLEKDRNIFNISAMNQHQSSQIYEAPKTETVSSVIRSVGNVKNLSCPIVATTKPQINQTCVEYKHKKYCRNNYNIDLYRKILGCDDDDDEEEKEQHISIQTPQSEDNLYDSHITKSSTPVHWRKSFKNNYETWSA